MTDSSPLDDLTVVVPVRNAELLLEGCLESIVAAEPREIIVVDGMSTDRTLEIAGRYPVRVLSDEGRGLPVARMRGAEAATTRYVALVDADVVLPPGSLQALLREFTEDHYVALQAGLESVGGPGYWGEALATHHRWGRSRWWFGLVATIFERDRLLDTGFDERFRSGEDIELRWRLTQDGSKIGVSRETLVTHRFADDSFDFARDQFVADGEGLGRMIRKHGPTGVRLAFLPMLAGIRGIVISLFRRQARWVRYYLAYAAYNYSAMWRGLRGP